MPNILDDNHDAAHAFSEWFAWKTKTDPGKAWLGEDGGQDEKNDHEYPLHGLFTQLGEGIGQRERRSSFVFVFLPHFHSNNTTPAH